MTDKPSIEHPTTVSWEAPGGVTVTLHAERGVTLDAPKLLTRHELARLQTFLDQVRELMEEGGVIELPKVDPLPVRPFGKADLDAMRPLKVGRIEGVSFR